MISVCFQGGLANRMFQYAFYRSLVAKGYDAYVDNYNFKPRKRMTFEAVDIEDPFPNIDIQYTPKGKFKFSCVCGRKGKILRYINSLIKKEQYVFEPKFKYCPEIFADLGDNCEIVGLWQTEKYFKDISEDLKKQFVFSPFVEKENLEVEEEMKKVNSVAIHVRKGNDYLSDHMWDSTCPQTYYLNAINYIKEHVEDPHFYLFTDNIDWVEDNIKEIGYTVVDWNPIKGRYNYRDMQLMSCAKHNIISNSSYSWWGAWLNSNPDKVIIAPKTWFNPAIDYFKNNDIICDSWIAL